MIVELFGVRNLQYIHLPMSKMDPEDGWEKQTVASEKSVAPSELIHHIA